MNIGDRVRLLHGTEEGIVYKFLPGNVVEIEIEEGFRIPVLRSEIVSVSPVEKERLLRDDSSRKPAAPTAKRPPAPFSEKGIYLVFAQINDREVSAHLINNTDWILPFTAFQDSEGRQTGIGSGVLSARSSQRLVDLPTKDIEQWPIFEIQLLYFKEGSTSIAAPFQRRLRCRAQSFYKRKQQAPVLNKEGYVYQLDDEGTKEAPAASPGISADQLRESMLTPKQAKEPADSVNRKGTAAAQAIVDLHLSRLAQESATLSNPEKLALQLSVFEQQFEHAIAAGQDEITFIHGAGNGVLRAEIHRRLSKHDHVQYFEDAQKEKFGYGATFVKIK